MTPEWLQNLHFLRPWWLLALLGLPVLAAGWRTLRRRRSVWQEVVDPHLLPHLIAPGGDRRSQALLGLALLAYLLAVLALAGPSWRRSAQPLWQSRMPLVVALDLSSATMAADLPPSRLAQARAKLAALLQARDGGPVGLVAFAGDAFTVAPLTDDAANVAVFLDALQPDVMPVDGQRADRAIAWSAELLERAGAARGDILVMTDHADRRAIAAAGDAAAAGFRVSVLGMGSEAGAVFRRAGGAMAHARLDPDSLQKLAAAGHGRYAAMRADPGDLQALRVLAPAPEGVSAGGADRGHVWQDEGYWLLPPLLLLALLAFRRRSGTLAIVLLLVGVSPVRAADLWRRPDQAAHARLEQGNAAYRRGAYADAARQYAGVDTADAHYNRGNALAKAGRYPQAIAAYDEALRRQPGMADALANKRAVEAAMQRQPPRGGNRQAQQRPGQSGDPRAQADRTQGASAAQQKSSPSRSPPQSPQSPPTRGPEAAASAQSNPASPPTPADPRRQEAADRAQRERMQRALQRARGQAGEPPRSPARMEETPQQRERRLANEAWLRRIPDDPGGLLRAKFRLEYERRTQQGRTPP